jgi:hypothetical protein
MSDTETIWDAWEAGAWVIVPTNMMTDAKGSNIMGGGVALEAARRARGLPERYGRYLKAFGADVYFDMESRFICFPTKYDWRQRSSAYLVMMGVARLHHILTEEMQVPRPRIVAPRLGCGLGGLEWDKVRLIVRPLEDEGVEFFPKETT